MTADGGTAPETVDCPFCAEPIRPQAIVCRHCRRDVGIPMPLMLAQRAQAREIEALRCEVVELRADLLAARLSPDHAAPRAAPDAPPTPGQPRAAILLAGWALGLAGLLALHALLVFQLDARTGTLRAACIAWPLVLGLLLPGFGQLAPRWTALLSASLGLAAVAGMSALVARVDGTPLLPATARDAMETLEFAVSIALAFAAGGLTRQAIRRMRERDLHSKALAQAREVLTRDGARKITDQAELLNRLLESSLPLLAMGGAVITGFRAILGGG